MGTQRRSLQNVSSLSGISQRVLPHSINEGGILPTVLFQDGSGGDRMPLRLGLHCGDSVQGKVTPTSVSESGAASRICCSVCYLLSGSRSSKGPRLCLPQCPLSKINLLFKFFKP